MKLSHPNYARCIIGSYARSLKGILGPQREELKVPREVG
jgi:hypothetical protein